MTSAELVERLIRERRPDTRIVTDAGEVIDVVLVPSANGANLVLKIHRPPSTTATQLALRGPH